MRQTNLMTKKLLIGLTFFINSIIPFANAEELPANTNSTSNKPQSTLKTVLPFQSSCDEKLTIIPPNLLLVKTFAEKTAIQTFSYDYKHSASQQEELESCYTPAGWRSFSDALKKSGNLRAAIDEKLFVSAKVNGEVKLIDSNKFAPNWKILVPLVVRYENETHYFEQYLKVKLVIGIDNQHLGVEQIIASPALKPHPYENAPSEPAN